MSSKTVNFKFVLGLIGAFALMAVPVHLLHGYQVRRNAHIFLGQADRALESRQLYIAAGYLDRYLALQPYDDNVIARLGLLLADDRLATTHSAKLRAHRALNRVLQRDPLRHDVRRLAVRMAIDLGYFTEALDDLQTRLAPNFPNDGELAKWLGYCSEKTKQFRQAQVEYERARTLTPSDLDVYLKLSSLLRQRCADLAIKPQSKDDVLRRAAQVMDEMVLANGLSYQAHLYRAQFRKAAASSTTSAQIRSAIKSDIDRARELAPDAAEVVRMSAEWSREVGNLEDAINELQRGCQLHPKNWSLRRALSRVEVQAGRPTAALECLRQGLKHSPDQIDLLWDLAEISIQQNKNADAKDVIIRLGKLGLAEAYRSYLTARVEMNAEQWVQAASRLEGAYPVLADFTGDDGNILAVCLVEDAGLAIGRCYERLGDIDRALKSFSRVVARNGLSVQGRLGMAWCFGSLGRLTDALDQYKQLMRLPGAPAMGVVEIARLLLLRNLDLPESERNWSEVKIALDQAAKIDPIPPLVVLLQAEILASQRQFEQAQSLLTAKFSDRSQRPAVIWAGLAMLEDRRGQNAAAKLEQLGDRSAAQTERDRSSAAVGAILDEAAQFAGDQVDLRLANARNLANRDSKEARDRILRLAETQDQFTSEEQRRLLRGLASACLKVGDAAAAVQLWERLAGLQPNDVTSRLVLFDLVAQTGDAAGMQKWQDELRRIESADGVLWRYARARILIEDARRGRKEGLAEARTQIAVVSAQRPDWPRVPLCEALVEDLSGQHDLALRNYLRALRLGVVDPLAALRAAELLYLNQRYDEANQWFRRVPDQLLFPQEVQQAAADAALRSQDAARALSLARAAIASDSKDYRHFIWLGWMNWKAGQHETAKSAFVHARSLADTKPDPWVALVEFLAASGQIEAARAEVEAARRKLSGSSSMLALARCYEVIGETERVNEQFTAALAAAPDEINIVRSVAGYCLRSGRLIDARQHLQKLLTLSRGKSPETYAMARRTLAYLLTFDGDPAKSREALALIGSGVDVGGRTGADTVEDLRVRAHLLAMQNKKESARQAIQILEELIEHGKSTAEDLFLAAQLHEAIGDWPKSRKRYSTLLSTPGADSTLVLGAAVRSLLRNQELDEAQAVLRRIEAREPDSLLAREIQARLLVAQGLAQQAKDHLNAYAKSPSADPKAVSALLQEFGDDSSAEALLRQAFLKSNKPDYLFALVHFLISRNRLTEALDLCEHAWTICPAVAVADACLKALAKSPPDPSQFGRVERQVRIAMQKSPDRPELAISLATVRSFQGDYDGAITLYRQVLDKNPNNAATLNNLAWLLALRGNSAEALALADRAVEASGQDAGALDTRAVAAIALGHRVAIERAIVDLDCVIAEKPTATAYFHMAQAYAGLNRRREATQAWQRAVLLGLRPEILHSLERPTYDRLLAEFGKSFLIQSEPKSR